jgi:hypothetical protein
MIRISFTENIPVKRIIDAKGQKWRAGYNLVTAPDLTFSSTGE